MKYVLGIDQGGSKTTAIISDQYGSIIGVGKSEGSLYSVSGIKHSMKMVEKASFSAIKKAGISYNNIFFTIAGMTGADWAFEYELLNGNLYDTLKSENIEVLNDSAIAMRGGTEKPFGSVICAGTGLNVYVKSPGGREHTFGYYIDSEYQGGGAIGRRAIRSVIDAEAGVARPTILKYKLLKYFNYKDVNELLFNYVNNKISTQVKTLAPLVFEAAEKGDEVSSEIIISFGTGAAQYVVPALRKFDMLNIESDVVLSGSIFKSKNKELFEAIDKIIKLHASGARIVNALYEPVVGAVILALEKIYHNKIPHNVIKKLDYSCKKCGLIRL